jgi:DNA mismatch repair protein MutS2
MWASQAEGVQNASVEFDERTLRPTYRLILGVAGASSGLEIARRMQVPEDILKQAKELLEPSHALSREYLLRLKDTLDEQENLRASLEEERAAVAEKYSRLEAEFAKREDSRRKEFESELTRVIDDFKTESNRAVRVIKDHIEAARIKRQAEKQAMNLRRKSATLQASADKSRGGCDDSEQAASSGAADEIREGDRVRVQSLDREGIVESIREGTYHIMIGPLRYRADRADLKRSGGGSSSAAATTPRVSMVDSSDEVISELKVIGLTADEALEQVDRFLDQAFLTGIETVRIIHGHGKGILRKAIGEFLRNHRQVERFTLAPPEKGGGGATIVELRK